MIHRKPIRPAQNIYPTAIASRNIQLSISNLIFRALKISTRPKKRLRPRVRVHTHACVSGVYTSRTVYRRGSRRRAWLTGPRRVRPIGERPPKCWWGPCQSRVLVSLSPARSPRRAWRPFPTHPLRVAPSRALTSGVGGEKEREREREK